MRQFIYIASICFTLYSCGEKDSNNGVNAFKEDRINAQSSDFGLEQFEVKASNQKTIGGISFGFSSLLANDYLSRIGKKVSADDEESLKKESVFMLVIATKSATKDILESEELTLDLDEATQYLIGKVTEDFVVLQHNKRIKPEGVQYDGKIGSGDKLRLTFFFKEVNLSETFTIEYYDRLFGKGLIKMKNTNNELISKL